MPNARFIGALSLSTTLLALAFLNGCVSSEDSSAAPTGTAGAAGAAGMEGGTPRDAGYDECGPWYLQGYDPEPVPLTCSVGANQYFFPWSSSYSNGQIAVQFAWRGVCLWTGITFGTVHDLQFTAATDWTQEVTSDGEACPTVTIVPKEPWTGGELVVTGEITGYTQCWVSLTCPFTSTYKLDPEADGGLGITLVSHSP